MGIIYHISVHQQSTTEKRKKKKMLRIKRSRIDLFRQNSEFGQSLAQYLLIPFSDKGFFRFFLHYIEKGTFSST